MQNLFFTLFLFCLVGTNLTFDLSDASKEWSKFLRKFGKFYPDSEHLSRFTIFQQNLKKIRDHNKLYAQNLTTYKMGVNFFADHTPEEFLKILTYNKTWRNHNDSNKVKPILLKPTVHQRQGLPASMDWRQYGAVTPVVNQGNCGGCWSFGTTGALESHYFLRTGRLVSLSKQQLIDCDSTGINRGCNGGSITDAFTYLIQYGAEAERDYRFVGYKKYCQYNPYRIVATMSNYVKIQAGSEYDLQYAVGTAGPVSVAVDATNFNLYQSGIYSEQSCNPARLNHAVIVIGYGSENGLDYWTIKNSWGWSYGEQGYIRILRNYNMCGIADDASYPVV